MTRGILIFGVMLALAACDVVKSSYGTPADARADRLFERGWLPDILPPSTKNTRVTKDLDINTTEGDFQFEPVEFRSFLAALTSNVPVNVPFRGWSSFVQSKTSVGYIASGYRAGDYQWVFLSNEARGHCEYRGWYVRGAA